MSRFAKGKKINKIKGMKGYALVVVILLAVVFFLIVGTINQRVRQELKFTQREADSRRAFYIAEAGVTSALYEMASVNYSQYTHDDKGKSITGNQRLPITLSNTAIDSQGWSVWEWKTKDTHKSFNDSGVYEKYRYRVMPYETNKWIIEVEGYYGNVVRKISVWGESGGVFDYAIYSNGDLSEFVRGANQTVNGRVHSNGTLYFRPSGSTLTIYSDSITSAGKMIRYQDAWGRPYSGGTVRISNSKNVLVTMEGGKQGTAFDSDNPLWLSDSNGAESRWGGVVKDGSLGAGRVEPPNLESMSKGGYYYRSAGLIITDQSSGTGIKNGNFYNMAEGRKENVKVLDLSKMTYPSNGLIYADTPVRIVNAQILKAPLTIVSNYNIYTQGDVNKIYGNKQSFDTKVSTKQPFALMTSQRIYHLSSSWSDPQNASQNSSIRNAVDPPLYTGDTDKLVEINAALVDSVPQVDEINYVKEWNGVTNPYYNGGKSGPVANSDDLLENWSGVTLRKRGSIVHLEKANMAKFDNSDYGEGVSAWVVKSHYNPPIRDYGYDSDLAISSKLPPFFPKTGKKVLWKQS